MSPECNASARDDAGGGGFQGDQFPPDLLNRIQEWALAGAADGPDPREPQELADLRRWLASLPVIEQAKGILMARYRIDADTAIRVLRRWSSHHNIKIREICQQLTAAAAERGPLADRTQLDDVLAMLEGPEIGPD